MGHRRNAGLARFRNGTNRVLVLSAMAPNKQDPAAAAAPAAGANNFYPGESESADGGGKKTKKTDHKKDKLMNHGNKEDKMV